MSSCTDADGGDERGAFFAIPRAAALAARMLMDGTEPAYVAPRLQRMAQDLSVTGYDTTLEVLPDQP